MGWDYEEPFRGMRIRQLLEAQDKFSGEDLIRIQNDDLDPQAEFALPFMLKALKSDGLSDEQKHWIAALENWDKHAKWDQVEPSLYKRWFLKLKHELFDDEYEVPERKGFMPKDIRAIWLLKRVSENPADSDADWVDDKKTPGKENLAEIVTRAFTKAWQELSFELGKDPSRWIWKRAVNTRLPHLARIPGFGSEQLEMSGADTSVRGNRGWHGAVYRTVVELGPHPRAWMQTPGGTSGDPFSLDFEHNTKDWAAGKMREVKYYKDASEARADGAKMIAFTPGEN
jgi:penicillin amidase